MSILGGTKKMLSEAGKIIIIPKKKEVKSEPKNFVQETPDEYAQRLMSRRNRRY